MNVVMTTTGWNYNLANSLITLFDLAPAGRVDLLQSLPDSLGHEGLIMVSPAAPDCWTTGPQWSSTAALLKSAAS